MRASKFDTKPVELLLEKHNAHTESYWINFKGIPLLLYPDVFNPTYTKVSGFLAEHMEIRSGESCLEMFSGSGALSFVAGNTASSVVGVDFSPVAIDCSTANALSLGVQQKVLFRVGDLWGAVLPEEKFDVIIANPPLLPAIPETLLEAAVADSPEMRLTRGYITGCPNHLTPNGRIYMAFSNACSIFVGDPLSFVQGLAYSVGLTMNVKAEWDVGYEVYRILEFSLM